VLRSVLRGWRAEEGPEFLGRLAPQSRRGFAGKDCDYMPRRESVQIGAWRRQWALSASARPQAAALAQAHWKL